MKLKDFMQRATTPEAMTRAVIRQVGGWREFQRIAEDVANHGADAGWSGFIWHKDTVRFAVRNKAGILDHMRGQALEYGCTGPIDTLAQFQCLKGYTVDELAEGLYNPDSDTYTQVQNALAWFALEECARSYMDIMEG